MSSKPDNKAKRAPLALLLITLTSLLLLQAAATTDPLRSNPKDQAQREALGVEEISLNHQKKQSGVHGKSKIQIEDPKKKRKKKKKTKAEFDQELDDLMKELNDIDKDIEDVQGKAKTLKKVTSQKLESDVNQWVKEAMNVVNEVNGAQGGQKKAQKRKKGRFRRRRLSRRTFNLKVDYHRILTYLRTKSPSRTQDILGCGLIVLSTAGKHRRGLSEIFFDLMKQTGRSSQNPSKTPPWKLCEPSELTIFKLSSMIGKKFLVKKVLKNGEKNLEYAARLLTSLAKTHRNYLFSSIYTLHLMSNLFAVELPETFYATLEAVKKDYNEKETDFFQIQTVNNEISKCAYSEILKKKLAGLDHRDLKVIKTKVTRTRKRKNRSTVPTNPFKNAKNPENQKSKISIKKGIKRQRRAMEEKYWHLNYPRYPERIKKRREYTKLCLKCKNVLIMVAQHLVNIGAESPEDREGATTDHLITKRTKLVNLEKKADSGKEAISGGFEAGKADSGASGRQSGSSEDTNDYYLLTEQFARRGDADAAIEMAQEYYFGNAEGGVPQNQDRALELFRDAARRDNWAQANYGLMLLNGNSLRLLEAVMIVITFNLSFLAEIECLEFQF